MNSIRPFSVVKNSPGAAAFAVVALSSLLHLLVMGQADLSVDEAHYALYGLFHDWSYFDHPPMVGWMQALVLPFSQSEFALRLWPLLLSVIASLQVYRLTEAVFPLSSRWTPFVAVVLLHSMLVFQLLGLALVPEMPLLVFGLAAMQLLWRAAMGRSWTAWLLFGVCLGLAGLSKYTAVILPVGAVLFLLWQSGWRSLFAPGLWLAAIVAILLVTPVLYWNAQHDWISFGYQLGHGLPERDWSIKRFLTALLGQVLAYGPAVVLFSIASLVAAFSRFTPGERLSVSMVLPLFALIFWGAGYEETLPHWTLMGWVFLLPLASHWLVKRLNRRWVKVTAWLAGGYSVLLVLLLHSLLFAPWVPFKPYRHPLTDLLGWRQAAEAAVELQQRFPATVIYVGNWATASRIAWYARPATVKVADKRYDQFDIWYGSPAAADRALLIVPDYLDDRDELNGKARFENCVLQEQFIFRLNDTPVHRFSYYICTGYHE